MSPDEATKKLAREHLEQAIKEVHQFVMKVHPYMFKQQVDKVSDIGSAVSQLKSWVEKL